MSQRVEIIVLDKQEKLRRSIENVHNLSPTNVMRCIDELIEARIQEALANIKDNR